MLDGYGAIERIMGTDAACPIVVLSASIDGPSSFTAARCFEVGAVEVLRKPSSASIEKFRKQLISVVRTMSKAQVVRRTRPTSRPTRDPKPARPAPSAARPAPSARDALEVLRAKLAGSHKAEAPTVPELVVIGSSTGGPPVLYELLKAVRAPLPCPVLVAQHILPGFDAGLVKWLAGTGHTVELVRESTPMRSGTVFVAPGDKHMRLRRGMLRLEEPLAGDMVPSADHLMASVAELRPASVVGIVLTGMGTDGALGLGALREIGADTYAQSAESCAVNGMPQAARDAGAVQHSLPPSALGLMLAKRMGGATAS